MKYIIIGCVIVFCFFQYKNVTVERNFVNSCAQTDPVTLKKYCKCVFDEIVDTQGIQAIKDADKQSAEATINQFQPEINYCMVSMNETREKLLKLAREKDISNMKLREIARELDVKNPQNIKFHLKKLSDAGLLDFKMRPSVKIQANELGASSLIRIPIMGAVSAGPATQRADNEISGYLRISSALLKTKNYKDLFALKVTGLSMNRANVSGLSVNDGDYAIVDSSKRSPKNGDYIVAVVDGLANLKKFLFDKQNNQIVLISESSEDYLPIFIHPQDNNEGLISGSVVQVVRQPVFA